MPQDNNLTSVRKDAFNLDTKTLEAMEADTTYSSNEQEMIEEIKRLLIQLINNGKGS